MAGEEMVCGRWPWPPSGVSPEIAAERKRVMELIQAHESWLGMAYVRIQNLIYNGVDLEEEAELPPEDRAGGFNWDDDESEF